MTSIVREERGVATRLLVQLKSVLDAMVRDVEQSKRAGVSALARSASLPTKPSLSVAQSHRGVGAFNSRLSTRRDADAKIFNDVVRAREARPNALMETSRVRAFLQEGERQKAEAAEAVRNRKIGISNRHADRRVEAVNAFNKTREAKAVRAASEYATHAEILRARADAERREIEIEMALEEKERLARVAREEREGEEALRGLDAFEKNLSRNAAGRKASDESSGTSGLGIPGGSRRDPREHLAAMRASLPDPRAMQREGERTIRRIKSDRSEEALARKERERRRRKLDAERERAGAAAEARRREDELLATLAVKSKQETRVAERLSALERERDVMRDNRRDRDARYEAQRRADWEAALRREAKMAAQRRAAYRADAAAAAADIDDALSASERERREDVRRFVGGALRDIVALACRCAEYREATEKLVPRREYREWTGLLVAGEPLPFALPSREAEVTEGAEAVTGGARVVTRLDEANARDYLRGDGDWARAALGSRLTPHDGGLGRERSDADADAGEDGEEPAEEPAEESTNATDGATDDAAEGTAEDDAKDEGGKEDAASESTNDAALASRMLGSAIFDVTVATLPDASPAPDALPDAGFDARLAIVGPPFCGKSTAARKLAESRALVLIDPNELTREAVTEAAAWRDAERAAAEAAAEEAAAEEAAAEEAAAAAAAGEGEGDAPGDDAPHDVGEAVPASGTEPSAEADPPSEPRKARQESPSQKIVFGLRALDAADAGEPVPASVVAGLIALAVDALAPPKPPRVAYPPPITDADLEGDGDLEEGAEGAEAESGEEEPLSEPAEDAPDEEKAAFAAAAAERSARAAAKDAARSALRLEKETARQAEIESIDAAYAASVAELEATYPRPPGYVIDGFPCTATEAAALERAFTGLDETRAATLRAAVSVAAPPAEHELAARASVSYVSGLDGIITLELPCEPDCQAATLRALGRRVDPETGIAYHLDFDPPPEDEPGLAERLRLCEPPEATDAERRLHAWNDERELEKLEAWLAKFETDDPEDRFEDPKDTKDAVTKTTKNYENERDETADVESGEPTKPSKASTGVRVSVDARVSAGEVFLAVEAEATRVLDSKRSARAVAAAADAAAVAAANCQKAAEAVEASGLALEKAAKQLLDLRKAEIEAKALVEEAGGGDAEAADTEAEAAASAGDVPETQQPAKPTAAASALLAEKASEAVAAELVRARKAAAEAAQHAADAEAAWQAAERAVADAKRARGDAEATASARAASEAALERAVAAGDAASASLRAAQEASASVDATVARADAAVAAADADDVAAAEAAAKGEPKDTDGADANDANANDAPDADDAEGSPDENTTDAPPVAEEDSDSESARVFPIPRPLAEAIRERWLMTERAYVAGLRNVLGDVREARALSVARFAETKTAFSEFLRRPDEKMSVVRSFQKEFNEIDLDHRRDPRTVGELLVRADELRDALWDVCDERLAENVAERGAVAADTWAADHAKAAVAHYCALVQLELDKFAETAPVLADYFAARRGEPLPEDGGAVVRGGEAEAAEGEAAEASETSPSAASWFEPPPPVPDVLGHDPSAGREGEGDEDLNPKPAVPPPPVPSPDDEALPEYVRALARDPPTNDAAPAAEGEAGGSSSASAEEDPDPVPGPPAPALAAALAAALEYVRAYAPEEAAAEGGNEAEAAEAEGGNEAGASSASASAGLRAAAETAAAMREERRVLETRLERIADRCATHVAELGDVARLCHARLAEMVKTKYKAECGAVAALAEEVKMAAENATPLEKDLNLTVSSDVLVVAEEETAIPPPPPFPAPPPAEPAPRDPGTFSGTQFRNLCAALACAAPSGVITPAECASVMERLGAAEGAPQLQTMQTEFSDRLPPAYAVAGRRRLANVARLFKFGDSPYVEWRALVASALAAMYPQLLDAPAETIAAAAAQLRAPAAAGKRVFAEARKLWFLPSGDDGCHEIEEEDAFAASQRTWGAASLAARAPSAQKSKTSGAGAARTLRSRVASGDVSAAAVMAGLAEAFGAPGADGEVDITMLALHLCVSATPELGAGKAVEVARWLTDPEAEREAKRAAERAERAAAREARRAKAAAEGRTTEAEDGFEAVEADEDAEEAEAPLPPMDYKEKRAAWCAAAGPGAMSATAVELLRKKDLEGKDVDIPAMAVASGVGGAAPLLGIATRKWFNRYGFKDCHAVVMM